jgi:hypothetical protein
MVITAKKTKNELRIIKSRRANKRPSDKALASPLDSPSQQIGNEVNNCLANKHLK